MRTINMKIAVVGAGNVGCTLAEAELPVSLRDANPVNAEQPDNGPAELLGRRDGGGGDPGLGRMSLMFDHFGFNAADFASLLAWRADAVIAAGGRDNGGRRIRANDAPTYYAAFVYDPDGHNVEAVCLKPE
jgi:hypothetical protein